MQKLLFQLLNYPQQQIYYYDIIHLTFLLICHWNSDTVFTTREILANYPNHNSEESDEQLLECDGSQNSFAFTFVKSTNSTSPEFLYGIPCDSNGHYIGKLMFDSLDFIRISSVRHDSQLVIPGPLLNPIDRFVSP